jgi:hypothetical protein
MWREQTQYQRERKRKLHVALAHLLHKTSLLPLLITSPPPLSIDISISPPFSHCATYLGI